MRDRGCGTLSQNAFRPHRDCLWQRGAVPAQSGRHRSPDSIESRAGTAAPLRSIFSGSPASRLNWNQFQSPGDIVRWPLPFALASRAACRDRTALLQILVSAERRWSIRSVPLSREPRPWVVHRRLTLFFPLRHPVQELRSFLPVVRPIHGVFFEPGELDVHLVQDMTQLRPSMRLPWRDVKMSGNSVAL